MLHFDCALKRTFAAIVTWPYALAVAVLLLNDWCLKAAFPGFVTGKLSDFAGLAVVAVPIVAAIPKRTTLVFVALAAAFAWWKSEASEAFIALMNSLLPIRLGRTVDYSDLIALTVLPWCREVAVYPESFAIRPALAARLLRFPIVAAAMLGVMGTSVIQLRQEYAIRPIDSTTDFSTGAVAEAVATVAAKHGLTCADCARIGERAEYSGNGVIMSYNFVSARSIVFKIWAVPSGLFFGASAYEKADRLRQSMKSVLAERFNRLEYVETLVHPREAAK